MKVVNFYYWSNLCRCMGMNVGGSFTIDLSDEETELLKEAIDPAVEYGDILEYFEENLPESLSEKLCAAIRTDFEREMTKDAIYDVGYDMCEGAVSEEEWDKMDIDKQVDIVLENNPGNCYADGDLYFVDIKIITIR